MINSLSKDVPACGGAPTTPAADRKEVVRHLVGWVSVAVCAETEWVDVDDPLGRRVRQRA